MRVMREEEGRGNILIKYMFGSKEGREEILIKNVFGSQEERRDLKNNLLFYSLNLIKYMKMFVFTSS